MSKEDRLARISSKDTEKVMRNIRQAASNNRFAREQQEDQETRRVTNNPLYGKGPKGGKK